MKLISKDEFLELVKNHKFIREDIDEINDILSQNIYDFYKQVNSNRYRFFVLDKEVGFLVINICREFTLFRTSLWFSNKFLYVKELKNMLNTIDHLFPVYTKSRSNHETGNKLLKHLGFKKIEINKKYIKWMKNWEVKQ